MKKFNSPNSFTLANTLNWHNQNKTPYKIKVNYYSLHLKKLLSAYFLKHKLLSSRLILKESSHEVSLRVSVLPLQHLKFQSFICKINALKAFVWSIFHKIVTISIKVLSNPLLDAKVFNALLSYNLKYLSLKQACIKAGEVDFISTSSKKRLFFIKRKRLISLLQLFSFKNAKPVFYPAVVPFVVNPLTVGTYKRKLASVRLSKKLELGKNLHWKIVLMLVLLPLSSGLSMYIQMLVKNYLKVAGNQAKFRSDKPSFRLSFFGRVAKSKNRRKVKYLFHRGLLKSQNFSQSLGCSEDLVQIDKSGAKTLKVLISF